MLFVLMAMACGCGPDAVALPDTGAPTDTVADDTGDTLVETGEAPGDTTDTGDIDTGPVDVDGDGWPASADCDDTDPSVHPGATDACGDGVDNDCDGFVSDDCRLLGDHVVSEAPFMLVGSDSLYQLGEYHDVFVPDLNGDGRSEMAVTCGEQYDRYWHNLYLFYSRDPGVYDVADAEVRVEWESPLGDEKDVGDLDLDGVPDLLLPLGGEEHAWLSLDIAPGVYKANDVLTWYRTDADRKTSGAVIWDDPAGDGTPTLLVQANNRHYEGDPVAWLLSAPQGDSSPDDAYAVIWADETWQQVGRATAADIGDTDGDGANEVAIPAEDVVGTVDPDGKMDAVAVFHGPIAADVTFSDAPLHVLPSNEYHADSSLTPNHVGDLDGDGLDDLDLHNNATVDDPSWVDSDIYRRGCSRVWFSPLPLGDTSLADADLLVCGTEDYASLGQWTATGDLDGDGSIDLALGERTQSSDPVSQGATRLFYGPFVAGSFVSTDADATIRGETEYHDAYNPFIGPDFDGDGIDDLAIGAPGYGDSFTGAIYLFPGQGW